MANKNYKDGRLKDNNRPHKEVLQTNLVNKNFQTKEKE